MVSRERIEEILAVSGVLMTGHFVLTSGRHAEKYMQCAQILQYPNYTEEILRNVAETFREDKADFVIAPAVGGILVAYELASQLGLRNLFTERENGVMTLRRGFTFEKGARFIVAEDVTTTGGTVFEVMELVKSMGGVIVGVGLIIDRSGGKINFGVKTHAAYTIEIESYPHDECPLCVEGIPVTKPGSRSLS